MLFHKRCTLEMLTSRFLFISCALPGFPSPDVRNLTLPPGIRLLLDATIPDLRMHNEHFSVFVGSSTGAVSRNVSLEVRPALKWLLC